MEPQAQQPFIYSIKIAGEHLAILINTLAKSTVYPYEAIHPLIGSIESQAQMQADEWHKAQAVKTAATTEDVTKIEGTAVTDEINV